MMLKTMLCGVAFAAVTANACAQENFPPEQIKKEIGRAHV